MYVYMPIPLTNWLGGFLTLSTSETTSGATEVCVSGDERGMGGCCGTCRVRCPMSRVVLLVWRKSSSRIASVVSPSAMTIVIVNGMSER